MASLFTKCCCVGNCFWGWKVEGELGEDYGYCSHNTVERLYLRIPRPAFTTTNYSSWPGGGGECCEGGFKIENTADGASDIICKYAHYPGESGSRLYNWKWYDPNTIIPPCADPHACWGKSTSPSDLECCDDTTDIGNCQGVWFNLYNPFASGPTVFSRYQRDICKGVAVAKKANTPTNAQVEDQKLYGDEYRWTENIFDYETQPTGDRFIRRWWNGSAWVTHLDKRLVETMFVVLHRTKWWNRDFNSLHPNDADPEDGSWCGGASEPTCGAYASCRTPEYWDYECSGFPIFTWEVYNAPTSVLSDIEKKALFAAADAGEPMNQVALDRLVAHLGCEPKDHGDELGRPVKRILVDEDGAETVHYAFARLAGWKHVCHDMDTEDYFPQWSTNTSTACDALPDSNNCWTAGPFPQETVCTAFANGGPATCTIGGVTYSACSMPGGCSNLYENCDGNNLPYGCALDSAVGDCSGIWFHYNQYCPFATATQGGYICCVHNEAFLCVVPDADSICDCDTLPFDGPIHPIGAGISALSRNPLQFPDFDEPLYPEYPVDPTRMKCCGGRGTYNLAGASGPYPYCDNVRSPNNRVCVDPDESDFCLGIGEGG